MQTKFGYLLADWEKAKLEMMEILIKLAKIPQPIFYGELVEEIETIQFEPNSYALFVYRIRFSGHKFLLSRSSE